MTKSAEDIPIDAGAIVRFGVITSVNLPDARCTVQLGDEEEDDSETAEVRWLAFRAGKTRIWSPPSIGEQCLLFCPEGEIAAAVAITGIVCDAFPPVGNNEKEMIAFEDGSIISYDAQAGAFEIALAAGATGTIIAPGGLTIDADVTINGEVQLNGGMTATDDVTADGISLTSHKHSGVAAGGAQTGTPV